MLMSSSTSYELTIADRLFDGTSVTPACRANDTTDIHLQVRRRLPEGAEPAVPLHDDRPDPVGKVNPSNYERKLGADLGLYSITPNNDLDADYVTLTAYKEFRLQARRKVSAIFSKSSTPTPAAARARTTSGGSSTTGSPARSPVCRA
jgi:hypothetical protein